ncbi:hypothetical protein H0194_04720 [Corynebacterium incognita]|uniref:Uncharacterized protein n=1 Tax=Corynebacterium incognita TaxID=2754725 RepID=A0A7G7CRR8_9CORY|nr:hypothetical protein [Corynebacterium incognita]QNE90284.1 hypothetical protein H0194_04720 [Corynebacterium incognita]
MRKTHAEAIAYADKQARTVTVTLPRSTYRPTERHRLYHGGIIQATRAFPSVDVAPNELRPLALALLAEHYKENTND